MPDKGVHIRVRYRAEGGHVHCRVFTAPRKELTHAKNGDLVFSREEWVAVWDALRAIADVIPEEAPENP